MDAEVDASPAGRATDTGQPSRPLPDRPLAPAPPRQHNHADRPTHPQPLAPAHRRTARPGRQPHQNHRTGRAHRTTCQRSLLPRRPRPHRPTALEGLTPQTEGACSPAPPTTIKPVASGTRCCADYHRIGGEYANEEILDGRTPLAAARIGRASL